MSNTVKGMDQLLKRLSGTNMKQRRMAGTIAGGIAGAASTPTKEDGTNSENFTRKALGGISGAVLGNRLGNFATNNNISRAATKAGGVAQKAHTKIMDSKLNDKVKNFAGGAFDKASRGANKVNKNFEVAPTTMTPANTVMSAVPVSFYDADKKRKAMPVNLLGPGKTTTASEFIDYLFEKVASEELEVQVQGNNIPQPNMDHINKIRKNGLNSTLINVEYKDAKGNTTQRTLEPYIIKGNDFWAYDVNKEGMRRFKLGNLQSVESTKDKFNPRWSVKL